MEDYNITITNEDGTVEECMECATCLDVIANTRKALEAIKTENPVLYNDLVNNNLISNLITLMSVLLPYLEKLPCPSVTL